MLNTLSGTVIDIPFKFAGVLSNFFEVSIVITNKQIPPLNSGDYRLMDALFTRTESKSSLWHVDVLGLGAEAGA